MTNEGSGGFGDILEKLKSLDPVTLKSMLEQSRLSTEDQQQIFHLFQQFASGTLDGNAGQNALALILKLYSSLNAEQLQNVDNLKKLL